MEDQDIQDVLQRIGFTFASRTWIDSQKKKVKLGGRGLALGRHWSVKTEMNGKAAAGWFHQYKEKSSPRTIILKEAIAKPAMAFLAAGYAGATFDAEAAEAAANRTDGGHGGVLPVNRGVKGVPQVAGGRLTNAIEAQLSEAFEAGVYASVKDTPHEFATCMKSMYCGGFFFMVELPGTNKIVGRIVLYRDSDVMRSHLYQAESAHRSQNVDVLAEQMISDNQTTATATQVYFEYEDGELEVMESHSVADCAMRYALAAREQASSEFHAKLHERARKQAKKGKKHARDEDPRARSRRLLGRSSDSSDTGSASTTSTASSSSSSSSSSGSAGHRHRRSRRGASSSC